MTLIVLGFVLFIRVPLKLSPWDDRAFPARQPPDLFKRSIVGMGMVAAGQLLRRVGARGLAGAGVVLDPEQAREELEPYSRMAGGMVKDALEEADINRGGAQPVVKIKCRTCAALNDDDAKFCKACGQPLSFISLHRCQKWRGRGLAALVPCAHKAAGAGGRSWPLVTRLPA